MEEYEINKTTFEKFRDTYIVTLEPYAKRISWDILYRDFRLLGFKDVEILKDLSREGEIVVRVEGVDYVTFSVYARALHYVSHIFELVYVLHDIYSIDMLKKLSRELLSSLVERYSVKTFRVTVKRVSKHYPLTSVELAKEVGSELSSICKVDLERADCHIYLEVRRDVVLIGYSLGRYVSKVRECVPMDVIDRLIVVVDDPQTLYEVMDLVQVSRALRIKLRIFDRRGRAQDLTRLALKKLGLNLSPETVSICGNVEMCLRGCDIIIVLSQYASLGETFLLEVAGRILSRGRSLCLVLGNELYDPEMDIRDLAHYEVRLGPCTGQAMRSVNALTYAVGVIVASYITSKANVGHRYGQSEVSCYT